MNGFISLGILIFFLIIPTSGYSQSVTNIKAEQTGNDIIITYDLNYHNQSRYFTIELFVSVDGGRTYTGPLSKVEGAIGEKIQPGIHRQIKWSVLEELSNLNSDEIIFEIRGVQKFSFDVEFVTVGEGTFRMGSKSGKNDEGPLHKLNISEFYLSKYEITQDQWFQVMGNNPSENKSCPSCPVENVSYNEVIEFLNKISDNDNLFRLPTEAEWEYAASNNLVTSVTSYSGSNNINAVAWYIRNSEGHTHPVGEKFPNSFGCYDMSGNVQEWVFDFYYPSYYKTSPIENPRGPSSGSARVIRGGGFNMSVNHSKIYSRNYDMPEYKSSNLGFRIVKIKK